MHLGKGNWLARLYLWANHRLYNEFAWAYDLVSWLVSLGHWSGWRKVVLDYATGPRILEVGFGTVELLIEMAGRGLQAYGLERSPAMQRVTARKMRRRGIRVPRVRAAVQEMPFADGAFDSILATFPSAYLADPATWHEIARLLHPPDLDNAGGGGCFVVAGACIDMDSLLLRRAMCLLLGVPVEHLLARWEQMAEGAGLHMTVAVRREGVLKLPVIVAQRCRAA